MSGREGDSKKGLATRMNDAIYNISLLNPTVQIKYTATLSLGIWPWAVLRMCVSKILIFLIIIQLDGLKLCISSFSS